MKHLGSYPKEDVTFLLKDLSHLEIELDNETREKLMAEGVHYSEMLPIEYKPTDEYMNLYYEFVEKFGKPLAKNVGILSHRIVKKKGRDIVLVSLARAGTPIGVLIKRYMKEFLDLDVPHYSISIIRGRGLDVNAISYILKHHPTSKIQFIDGWTGKGAITRELKKSCAELKEKEGIVIDEDLAVVADPGHCAEIYGTRDDLLIPSSCLNSTVSGLMSRTVFNPHFIGENDFHGAKYYKELENDDVSLAFIEKVVAYFKEVEDEILLEKEQPYDENLTWKGLLFVEEIQKEFDISDINKIKPGVGETTRVLLRRVPWKILIRDTKDLKVQHLLILAKDRNVPVEIKKDMPYACCGIIKDVTKEN